MSRGEFGTQVKHSLLRLPEMEFEGEFNGGALRPHTIHGDGIGWRGGNGTQRSSPIPMTIRRGTDLIGQFGAKWPRLHSLHRP